MDMKFYQHINLMNARDTKCQIVLSLENRVSDCIYELIYLNSSEASRNVSIPESGVLF
jgi:hypothetical protein